ncbi:ankyrin repeat domain-containing protein 10-like isoform X2 [Gigantopelta aegis]|uniref:ankyrin repeat domain-containing protein 10-like isoform X2 n=1 Tax=Gigantopelta aegis TaxID=1735272 RepID=UPI001B887987|nr:ankyrin repeat domain-containing protein 10-like isoform X2 [Gigantopelta aegis]
MDNSSNGQWWKKQSEDILRKQYPLHCAVRDGNVEEMLSLLKTGEHDLYQEDDFYGWTPTHWAAYFGKLACLRKLVSLTTSNVRSCRNLQNLAHVSSEGGHPHCLHWLMQTGTDFACQDYLGETPVHKAARVGSMECVSLLISQGASLCMKNHSSQVPSMVAAISGFHECSNYIEKAMQLQQQNLYTIPTKTCLAENNNIQASAFHESHRNELMNGHANSNGHSEMSDMETEMDMTSACPDSLGKPSNSHLNGFSLPMANGDVHADQARSDYPLDYRSLTGTKRGRDDCEDECFKRRRVHDKLHMRQDESANNNNVLSSYNAILAISVHPLPRSTHDSQTPLPDSYANGVSTNELLLPTLSASAMEHQASLQMQHGYDSVLSAMLQFGS